MQDPTHELELLRTRLHDTTLQALELIARSARDPHAHDAQHGALAAREAARLREYLEGISGDHTDELECGLRAMVAEARDLSQHEVQLIPGPTDGSVRGIPAAELIAATREALTNARKHASASRVIVYCEASNGGALVTIKDDGLGVDLSTMEAGLGVRRSIYARMARIGGNALLDSSPGEGTLVTLWLEADIRGSAETQPPINSDGQPPIDSDGRQQLVEELGQRQRQGERAPSWRRASSVSTTWTRRWGPAPLIAQSELTQEQALLEAERSSGAQSDFRNSTRSSISLSVNSSGATVDSSL
jgi:hypothetical protein